MGVGCSFCGPEIDRSSYDLSQVRNQDNGRNSTAFEQPTGQLRTTLSIESELTGSEDKKQSHCQVVISESSNRCGTREVERPHTSPIKDDATLEGSCERILEVEKQIELNFSPGHANRAINASQNQAAGHAKTSNTDQELITLNHASDEEIAAIVERCWKDIESSCKEAETIDKVAPTLSENGRRKGWRAVRLFVSSTFADYHAEREFLVKKVVPELHEWCEERLIHLIECDLRWGVPKDSTTESTMQICLGEIDRCSKETNGEPFFLNMLGERYGWIPSSSEVSLEILEEYNWIFNTSITHMEIIHAAYRNKSQNAAFLIRSPEFLKDLPPGMTQAFIDSHPFNKAQLQALKEKLRDKFPKQVFDYSCQYDGVDESSGIPKVKLKGLDDFGESVLEFFKSAISRLFPEKQDQLSPEELDMIIYDNFVELRGQLVLGRSEEISAIVEYAKSGIVLGVPRTETLEPLLILGSSGSGKSSLLACCTQEIKKLGLPLFYHFVGAGPGSADLHKLVLRLVKWLKGFTIDSSSTTTDLAFLEEVSLDQLAGELKKDLEKVAPKEESFVIIIDAVNQLADCEASDHVSWLPSIFPHNVHCIISTVTDSRSSLLLSGEHRTPAPIPLHVGQLGETTRREIVTHTLGKYNKKLDTEQMGLLIGSSGATNPLWFSLACEELRVFGVFETITHHIRGLPGSLKELLQLIINRLNNEDESNNVKKVLCLLECSKGGLTETELRYMLSGNSSEPLPMMMWAQIRRTLRPFLRNIGRTEEQERLEFFHASISEVVMETFLVDPEEKKKYHAELAEYFVKECREEDRVIFMVPLQLKLAGDKKKLLEFLRKDQRSLRRPGFWKNSYYKELRCNRLLQDKGPFTHEVNMCQFCSMQRGGFGDMMQLNRDSCFVCGRFTPWKDKQRTAMVCQWHKPPTGPPNMKMCFICKKPAFQNACSACLCPMCSDLGIRKCAMLVAD